MMDMHFIMLQRHRKVVLEKLRLRAINASYSEDRWKRIGSFWDRLRENELTTFFFLFQRHARDCRDPPVWRTVTNVSKLRYLYQDKNNKSIRLCLYGWKAERSISEFALDVPDIGSWQLALIPTVCPLKDRVLVWNRSWHVDQANRVRENYEFSVASAEPLLLFSPIYFHAGEA